MILAVRTDNPVAELYLYNGSTRIAGESWQAHRQLTDTIHQKIESLLIANDLSWKDISGVIVYSGPGSFTGLRIGATVANTLAYALAVPIVGASGDNWLDSGLKMLIKDGEDHKIVLPQYGGQINITQPKK